MKREGNRPPTKQQDAHSRHRTNSAVSPILDSRIFSNEKNLSRQLGDSIRHEQISLQPVITIKSIAFDTMVLRRMEHYNVIDCGKNLTQIGNMISDFSFPKLKTLVTTWYSSGDCTYGPLTMAHSYAASGPKVAGPSPITQ